ncbi:major capsid protein [Undibacterium sp.]|uniref:major capsid protein n=1 Tax=Undibacterium sp. TaxID=1914977 RepID=UPI0025DD7AA2|nr:major capsid protein [Undibacterium sp.]
MNKFIQRGLVLAGVLAVSGVANAAVDTAAVTGELTSAGTAIGVVGAAVLGVIVGTKVFKWIARAL